MAEPGPQDSSTGQEGGIRVLRGSKEETAGVGWGILKRMTKAVSLHSIVAKENEVFCHSEIRLFPLMSQMQTLELKTEKI